LSDNEIFILFSVTARSLFQGQSEEIKKYGNGTKTYKLMKPSLRTKDKCVYMREDMTILNGK